MSIKAEQASSEESSKLDLLKWLIAIALVAAAVVGNSWYSDQPVLYRAIGVVALVLLACVVAAQTAPGKAFLQLLKDARGEIRKVVWPTRAETRQTTLVVVVIVIIMAIILMLVDKLFGTIISAFIG